MTLEEESRLSFYRELTVLDEKKNIVLVQDRRNSELCVKKTLDIYSCTGFGITGTGTRPGAGIIR